jgi:hypothetical protein
MANKFGDRLERQRANDHGGVQNRPKQRGFNVRRVIRRVNTDVDEFMADNANLSNVDFEDVSIEHREYFG